MTVILISSKPMALQNAIDVFETSATVEAEYGDVLVLGTEEFPVLAHHGNNSHRPCPCTVDNVVSPPACIGLSHLDLDSLGGVLALLGRKPEAVSFWKLAAFVDINGPHKLGAAGAGALDVARLQAWWAWSETHRVFAPRDGSCVDITTQVEEAEGALCAILNNDPDLLEAGRVWAAREAQLEVESFVDGYLSNNVRPGVLLRVSEMFVNHLYTHGFESFDAVVALNTKTGSITLSYASPTFDQSACGVVQTFWGPLAGGHRGIAGSPRDMKCSLSDARELVEMVRKSGY